MGELTQLGKFLRKLRIDRSELLRDMAKKLDVALSFLSAVENGKKNMPSEWIIKLADLYTLSDEQKKDLDAAVAESEKGIGVKFAGLSADERKLSVAFARKIQNLSKTERSELQLLRRHLRAAD